MICSFELEGEQFTALNGGPHFKFNEAISLVVDCRSQRAMKAMMQMTKIDIAALRKAARG